MFNLLNTIHMKRIKALFSILLIAVCSGVYAQNITVKGTVTDAQTGDPVPAAAVVVSGTAEGVVTDLDGAFSITASSSGTLIFSSIGYETMQVPIRGQRTVNVELTDQLQNYVSMHRFFVA